MHFNGYRSRLLAGQVVLLLRIEHFAIWLMLLYENNAATAVVECESVIKKCYFKFFVHGVC